MKSSKEWIEEVRRLAKERGLFDGDVKMINNVFSVSWLADYILEGKTPKEAFELELSTWIN